MEAKFSPRVKDVITYSREEALRLGHDYIGTEHLLLGLIREGEGMAIKFLKSLNINLVELRKSVENAVKGSSGSVNNLNNIPLTKQAEKALKITYLDANSVPVAGYPFDSYSPAAVAIRLLAERLHAMVRDKFGRKMSKSVQQTHAHEHHAHAQGMRAAVRSH